MKFENTDEQKLVDAISKIQVASTPIPLPTYSGELNAKPFASFVNEFNKVATALAWNDDKCCRILPALLKNRAAEAYDSLDSGIKTKWKEMIDELARKLTTIYPANARRQLHSRRKRVEETFHDYAQAIKSLARIAYPNSDGFGRESVAKIAAECFVKGLEINLRERLLRKEEPFENVDKAVEAAIIEHELQEDLARERAADALAINALKHAEDNKNQRGQNSSYKERNWKSNYNYEEYCPSQVRFQMPEREYSLTPSEDYGYSQTSNREERYSRSPSQDYEYSNF